MISQELIDRGGSKLEITRALIESGIDVPIPRSTWKYYGQSLDSILPEFQKMRKPVIVRGSHKNDYHGFIDVIPTIKEVNSYSELEKAVKRIEEKILEEDVKIHCEDWNQPYTEEVHVLIQEQSPSSLVGSMIRHPHNKDFIDLEYIYLEERGFSLRRPPFAKKINSEDFSRLREEKEEIVNLVEMYKRIENSGIIDSSYSQQVEFGLSPLFFYQARPFKKFKKKGKFRIPSIKEIEGYFIYSDESFGVTPEEGIDVNFVFACDGELEGKRFGTDGKPYGLMIGNKKPMTDLSIPIGARFGNILAYCSPCGLHGYLFHNNYRLMKKAEYSLMYCLFISNQKPSYIELSEIISSPKPFEESRLISNGENAIIIPKLKQLTLNKN